MFIEIVLAFLAGSFAGIFTGLIPGIHINLISILLLTISPILLKYTNPVILACFIISMAVTHTFLDFIPGIFLGAPDAETALAILPGHRMLLEGKAFEAVKITVIGSLGSLLLAVMFAPIFLLLYPIVYSFLKSYIGYLLIAICSFMILKDKKKVWNLVVFMMSGVLGLLVLNMPNLDDPLLPLLSGLFGTSMLTISFFDKVKIPKQTFVETLKLKKSVIAQALSAGTFAGSLTSFFPGLGPAQGAVLAQQFTKNIGDKGFMIIVGAIGTVNFILSLITFYTIEKARNGAVIVIKELLLTVSIGELLVFFSVVLIVGGSATFLTLKIAKIFAVLMEKVNYQITIVCVFSLICVVVFLFSGFMGLLVLATATFIGIIPGELGVARNHSMGCLLLPVILYLV